MNKMIKIFMTAPMLLGSLTLGGCDAFRNAFGLDHSSPDAWKTAEPSPGLILPPDFGERPRLPPPTPGAPNPHVIPDTVKAQQTVLGEADSGNISEASAAKGEKDILEKASENQKVAPNIRSIVDEESQIDSGISGKVIAKIQSWKKEAAANLSLSKPKSNESPAEDNGLEDKSKRTNTSEKNGEE